MDFSRSREILESGLRDGLFSAASWAVLNGRSIVDSGQLGRVSFDPATEPVTPATLFDVASLTKPVVTATLTMQLVEQGHLTLNQSVGKALVEHLAPCQHLDAVEVKHLLTHTSGLPPIPREPDASGGSEAGRALIASLTSPLLREPGLAYTYSDTGYIVLGKLIEIVGGAPLEVLARRQIFEPAGMTSAQFRPPATTSVARTASDSPPGIVHDPRARSLDRVAGHAGLFATVDDLVNYAYALRSREAPILSSASYLRMFRNQLKPEVGFTTYGWFCGGNDMLPGGDLFHHVSSVGHSGFTGCLMLFDGWSMRRIILLTNRVLNEKEDGVRYLRMRRQWINNLLAELTKLRFVAGRPTAPDMVEPT